MTALEEMGELLRSLPGPRSSAQEVAAWYAGKARLLEHLAGESAGAEADRMHAAARAAARHALSLTQNNVGELATA